MTPFANSPNTPPEYRLLLSAGKTRLTKADVAAALSAVGQPSFSWLRTQWLADSYGLGALLSLNMELIYSLRAKTPARIIRHFDSCRTQAALREQCYRDALSAVWKQLAAVGVRPALMKGICLIRSVYPPHTRLLNDFDVLVLAADVRHVAAALQDHGFRKAVPSTSAFPKLHEVSFVKTVGRRAVDILEVDVHWNMHSPRAPFRVDTASVLARASEIPREPNLRTVSAEDTLINYGIQLVTDGYVPHLLRLMDIYALSQANLAWDKLCDEARDTRTAGAVYLALTLAIGLGAEVPNSVLKQLKTSNRGCWVTASFIADPRWVSSRSDIPRWAEAVLDFFLCRGLHGRLYGPLKLTAKIYLTSKAEYLKVLAGSFHALKAITLASAWGIGLLLATISERLGWASACAFVRSILWQPAAKTIIPDTR